MEAFSNHFVKKYVEFKKVGYIFSVWKYFLREVNGQTARCKLCFKVLKTTRGSTKGLHVHLNSIHKIDVRNRSASKDISSPNFSKDSKNSEESVNKSKVAGPASPLFVEVKMESTESYYDENLVGYETVVAVKEEPPDDVILDAGSAPSGVKLVCYHCGHRSVSLGKLRCHVLIRHSSTSTQVYRCKLCCYRTTSITDLCEQHYPQHPGVGPFSCPLCPYAASQTCNLRVHIKARHTLEKPYKCTFCPYMCVASGRLRKHVMARHTGEKQYRCELCNYMSIELLSLKLHIRAKHTGEKPFKCSFCIYECVESGRLKRHIMAKHTGEKPYKCSSCHYRAVDSTHLKRHVLAKHDNNRPVQCTFCCSRFVSFHSLKRHVRVKHRAQKSL